MLNTEDMTMSINSKYYDENAEAFISDTFECDMSVQYHFFEHHLPKEAKTILDLGFGSGRDSLYFMNKGFEVYAVDPSKKFCDNANKIGIKHVYQTIAQKIDFVDLFDGIWACASLLHVPSKELNATFKKCYKSLRPKGVMYASFKYGDFEGERNGREFLDLNERSIDKFLKGTGFNIKDILITEDVRPDKTTKWLNVILSK